MRAHSAIGRPTSIGSSRWRAGAIRRGNRRGFGDVGVEHLPADAGSVRLWPCPWPLDLAALNRAAGYVLGTHDFTSFAASDPDMTARETDEAPADAPFAPSATQPGMRGRLAGLPGDR